MPHVIIYSEHLSQGPTFVANKDEILREYLNCISGDALADAQISASPLTVLDKLEQRGYKLVAMASNNGQYVWTLHKPEEIEPV